MIYDILKLIGLSFFGMLVVFPISFLDVEFMRMHANNGGFPLTIIAVHITVIVVSDTAAAFVGYKFSNKLSKLLVRKKDNKKAEKSVKKIDKWGMLGFYFFSCTPLPITIAVYYAGAKKYRLKKFLIAVFFGRLTKYIFYSLAIYLGIEIVKYITL